MKIRETNKGNFKLKCNMLELQVIEAVLNYEDTSVTYNWAQQRLNEYGATFKNKEAYEAVSMQIWDKIRNMIIKENS